MEKRDKYQAIRQEAASDVGIGEIVIAHVIIVKPYNFIDLDLFFLDLILSSLVYSEGSKPEFTIVRVNYSKACSLRILNNLVGFYVL